MTVRALRARRGGREVLRIEALDVAAGERLGVLGPNGAGKTTLLRLIGGLDPLHGGEVRVEGMATRDGGVALRRRVGYVAGHPRLLTMSIRANVELPLRYRGIGRHNRRLAAEHALARLGIADLAERPAHAVSRGEAQRTSLARALVCEPALLLLDEPAASLDADARKAFLADLDAALAGRATTVVHVSHRPGDLLAFADRIAVLAGGALHQVSSPDELTRRPADALVARLIGFENVMPIAIGDGGAIELAGQPMGITVEDVGNTGRRGGERTLLAIWAAGIEVLPSGAGPLPAKMVGATPGPGRWDVALDAGVTLRAHHPLGGRGAFAAGPPEPGTEVALALRPELATIVQPGPEEALGPAQRMRRPVSSVE